MTTAAFYELLRLRRHAPRSITHLCELIDARYGIPRPAASPHLPPYQAATAFLGVCAEGVLIVIAGLFSALTWWKIAYWLSISIEVELFCHAIALAGPLISLIEVARLPLPYLQLFQRSTYGTSRWADARLLEDLNLARRKSEPIRAGELPLGGLGGDYDVVLNAAQAMCHLALFGPPGSGKSATFFMTWRRAWSANGSAIVLDPKGELYDQTAYKFENVYRIDLQDPERSDRWNFLPSCRHADRPCDRLAVHFCRRQGRDEIRFGADVGGRAVTDGRVRSPPDGQIPSGGGDHRRCAAGAFFIPASGDVRKRATTGAGADLARGKRFALRVEAQWGCRRWIDRGEGGGRDGHDERSDHHGQSPGVLLRPNDESENTGISAGI